MINSHKKSKTVSLRITEQQLLILTSMLISENRNKSDFLREQIEKYGQNCRKDIKTSEMTKK
jgi:hypothetical protein